MAWSVLKTSGDPPKARGGHTATLVEKNLLVCGGQQHQGGGKFEYFSLDPYVLDTDTLAWYKPRVALGKGPSARSFHTSTRVDHFLVIFGGRGEKTGGSKYVFNDLPCFDLVNMTWEIRDVRGRRPSPRYWHTACLHERRLFVFGGYDGSKSLKDVNILDIDALVWSQPQAENVPLPLSSHTADFIGDSMYVFGGMSITISDEGHSWLKYSDDVFALDIGTMKWQRLRRRGTQPAGRAYHTVSVVGGTQLLVLGGWSGECIAVSELCSLDVGLGTWFPVGVPGQSPPGMYGHSTTTIGSKIVVFGGWDSVSPLNTVNVLDTTQL